MGAGKGTITRRMDGVLDGLQSEFKALYDRADFERKLWAIKKAGIKSGRPSKLRELFDMFDLCGIDYERGRDNEYYENLVNSSDIPSFAEIENRMLIALFERYDQYPSPEDYMKRIVDRLCTAEDGWENDILRIRILKQFIKYGNYLADAGYSGRKTITDYIKNKTGKKASEETVLSELDDAVFDGLETATKAQKKPEGKFGLLKVVDDLASGKFRTEGATKRSLYLFAMVYGMTYYSGKEDGSEIIDYRTDVESNLFRDYYANNLMRFISDVYRGRLCEYELDPTGQGINYKNFAEMIYLYYISKDCSSQDKIRLSSEMIERVKVSQFKCGKIDTEAIGGTVFYRDLFCEDILSMSEADFEEFICKNYDCDTFAGNVETKKGIMDMKTGVFQMETEQHSAFEEYQAILKALAKQGVSLENCNYGLWFTDVAAFKKKGYENICDRRHDIDRTKFKEFIELLLGINNFMGYTVDETISTQTEGQEWSVPSKMKTKALHVESPDAVTRTSMIVAYYYYYNAVHENDVGDRWKNFEEVFNNFKMDIDPKLAAAYYQPLSGKNIFDVLVAFSSYAYLNV
jgi:hypothetical protein